MAISQELLDELLSEYQKPEDLLGDEGLLKQLKKALIERVLEGELEHHLGYAKYAPSGRNSGDSRNGKGKKTLKTEDGPVAISVPRDRDNSFEPQLVKKGQTRFSGFDDRILSMYARGMTVREIQDHLSELYGTEVSPEFISTVTDAVLEEVGAWQNRPLDNLYPILYMDALQVKVRDNGHITNKALYIAIGVNMEGHKEVLGLWIAKTEGAKFWLQVMTELRNRGLEDIFICCVDGLKGFPEAISSVFPHTQVQLCIVHMVRYSLNYVPWKDRKAVAADLRAIYTAPGVEAAEQALGDFQKKWDDAFPTIAESWRRNWQGIIPFLAYPDYIRKAIYTTNAIEAANRSVRKIIKSRGAFPNDEAVMKLVYLVLQNVQQKWTMPIREWKMALNQFAILFADRFPQR